MRKQPAFVIGAALMGLACVSPALAQTAPLFYDGFTSDNGGQPAQNFNGFIQWSVTGGTVNLESRNDPVNGLYVNLAGSSGSPGAFTTKAPISFVGGVDYTLSFDYFSSGGQAHSATATLGKINYTVTTDSPTLQTFSHDFAFPDDTSESLTFQDLLPVGDSLGIDIDNVLITPAATNVPAPGLPTLALVALSSGWYLRRRKPLI